MNEYELLMKTEEIIYAWTWDAALKYAVDRARLRNCRQKIVTGQYVRWAIEDAAVK